MFWRVAPGKQVNLQGILCPVCCPCRVNEGLLFLPIIEPWRAILIFPYLYTVNYMYIPQLFSKSNLNSGRII